MSTMNVLICQQPKELVWKQREIPIPGDNEALMKISLSGLRYRYSCLGWKSTSFLVIHVF